jgi:hypothetical protein
MKMKYKVISTPDKKTDMHPIQIDEGEFTGCQIIYGRVSFVDDEDTPVPTLKFDYEVVNDYNVSMEARPRLERVVGDVLVQIIEDIIQKGEEIIYTGGLGEALKGE